MPYLKDFASEVDRYARFIFENLHEGVVIFNQDTTIVFVNRAYEEILGVDGRKVLGRMVRKMEPHAKALQCLETGKPLLNVYEVVESVNKHIVQDAIPIIQRGEVVAVVCFFRDVSQLTRLSNMVRHLQEQNRALTEAGEKLYYTLPQAFRELESRNGTFQNALRLAAKIADTDVSVLIQGESGVGKEVVARAIHASSRRKGGPFVAVNCAAISETLWESEFFGYADGAFTGAARGGRRGKFEMAQGGTLFLDEIGEIPLSMQAKLLRALQGGDIQKVGSQEVIYTDVRVISATNRNLRNEIANGRFRDDLFYRLAVITIDLPPLRERPEDIVHLTEKIARSIAGKYGRAVRFADSVWDIFLTYDWPGNVRELENVVQHAILVAPEDTIQATDLPEYLRTSPRYRTESETGTSKLGRALEDAEYKALQEALRLAGNNRSVAMRILGISRRTFYKKMRKHGFLYVDSDKQAHKE